MGPWIQDAVDADQPDDIRAAEREQADKHFAHAEREHNGGAAVSPSSAAAPPALFSFQFTVAEARVTAAAIHCAIGLLHHQGFSTAELEAIRDRFLGGVQ